MRRDGSRLLPWYVLSPVLLLSVHLYVVAVALSVAFSLLNTTTVTSLSSGFSSCKLQKRFTGDVDG